MVALMTVRSTEFPDIGAAGGEALSFCFFLLLLESCGERLAFGKEEIMVDVAVALSWRGFLYTS
jgi:hypothetical protein